MLKTIAWCFRTQLGERGTVPGYSLGENITAFRRLCHSPLISLIRRHWRGVCKKFLARSQSALYHCAACFVGSLPPV